MPIVPRLLSLLLLVSLPIAAAAQQLPQFGEAVPLANTRYVPPEETVSEFFAPDAPLLRTNGRDAFVFTWGEDGVRVTRAGAEPRIGRVVFPFIVTEETYFDAVWTGTHFFVVAVDTRENYMMWGRQVSAAGEPVESPVLLGQGLFPALASNGERVLLLYTFGGDTHALALHPDGRPAAQAQRLPGRLTTEAFAVASNGSGFAAVLPADSTMQSHFALFGPNGQLISAEPFDARAMQWTVASDGERYLVAGSLANRAAVWLFGADGSVIATRELAEAGRFYRAPQAVWAGDRWIVSRVADNEGEVLELSADAKGILSTVRTGRTQVGLARHGSVLGAWWANRRIVVGTYPFTSGWTPVVHKAADQRLLATATSSNGTLFVWSEVDGLHAGFRSFDGSWRESVIDDVPFETVVAASDGTGFVVISNRWILRLDARGERLGGSPMRSPFYVSSIVWNGHHYGLAGLIGSRIGTAVLTNNAVSAPEVISPAYELAGAAVLAAGEQGFMAVWLEVGECHEFCVFSRIRTMRLDASLRRVGPPFTTETIEDTQLTGALDLAWNGSAYVLAYSNASGVFARDIDAAGRMGERRTVHGESGLAIRVVPFGGDVVIGWRGPTARTYRASIAGSAPLLVREEPRLSNWDHMLTKLEDGRLAFTFSAPQESDPYQNSMRLMLSIADAAPAPRPNAPVVTLNGNELSWTRPAGDVNGYRVEQRIGDDAWRELESWFDADERSMTVTSSRSIWYRVRAIGDSGAGAYSNPVRAPGGRRRSAR